VAWIDPSARMPDPATWRPWQPGPGAVGPGTGDGEGGCQPAEAETDTEGPAAGEARWATSTVTESPATSTR
jgi:hypothetical protein